MSNAFNFSLPTQIIFQPGGLQNLGSILAKDGMQKVLLVTDPGVAGTGLLDAALEALKSASVEVRVFQDVQPNPSIENVQQGVDLGKDFDFQALVALGGGSPMDMAKGIAILVTNPGPLGDYEGLDKFPDDPLPIYAIPTTAGTGSEVTPFTIITDKVRKFKIPIGSQRILPRKAILDPMVISGLPAQVAAATGMDALTHAMEAYQSQRASFMSDAFAEKAIQMIGANLRLFVANRKNLEAAGAMLVASSFAGLAFSMTHLGIVHAMAHPLGGFFNLPHGLANAILLPYALRFNYLACPAKFDAMAKLLGGVDSGKDLADAVQQLNSDLGIPAKLSELGVKEEAFEGMCTDAMKSINVVVNPRQVTFEDLVNLYKQAL